MLVEAAKASGGGSAIWPFITAVVAALIGFAGSAYAVIAQRKINRQQREDKQQSDLVKKEEETLRANVTAQVTLTKDVLDNWKGIVANLGKQITDLHGQVERLENRERRCQVELLGLKAKLLEIEGKVNSRGSDGL